MKKYYLDEIFLPRGLGWLFGAVLGFVIFYICTYFIEEIGFIIGVTIGLGVGSTIGVAIEIKYFKDISQDEIIEKKHLLLSSLLLIIFGLVMITYLLFN